MSEGPEPLLDDELISELIRMLMRIEAKLDELLALFEEEDDAEEDHDA